jgi:Bacterial regulatory helix-turn-helix protein, lysR family
MSHWTGVKRAKAPINPGAAALSPGIRRLLASSSKDFCPQAEGMDLRVADELFKFKSIYDTGSSKLIVVEECSRMEFTSRQFRAFVLVAQHRSFSRAAEALYITPSGLSVLIREL